MLYAMVITPMAGGNRIAAVCNEWEYPVPENAEVIEVGDGTILPGFIDTHSHPDMLAAWAPYAYCGGTADLASALDVLQRHGREQDQPVPMGYGFDDTAVAEQRGPNLAEMDALFPDRPAPPPMQAVKPWAL